MENIDLPSQPEVNVDLYDAEGNSAGTCVMFPELMAPLIFTVRRLRINCSILVDSLQYGGMLDRIIAPSFGVASVDGSIHVLYDVPGVGLCKSDPVGEDLLPIAPREKQPAAEPVASTAN